MSHTTLSQPCVHPPPLPPPITHTHLPYPLSLHTQFPPIHRRSKLAAAPLKNDSWVWQRRKRAFDTPAERACTVFCEGDLLQAVQLAGIFQDSKEFVDMPMRVDPEIILDKFSTLNPEAKQDKYTLSQFVNEHFLPPGSELVAIQPQDFTDTPSVLSSLTPNSTYYGWAQYLNQAFASLTRKVSEDVFLNPQRYSILRRTHPVVIPGGRFRESYYWDSYWIVLGLLACDMKDTARGLVQNLLDDVANFGFVPNGGRIYYLNRSQPPLLSEMVLALLEADEALMKGKRVVNVYDFRERRWRMIFSFLCFLWRAFVYKSCSFPPSPLSVPPSSSSTKN